jgi:hypothetical protein
MSKDATYYRRKKDCNVLRSLHLPEDLIECIRDGTLGDEIEKAYAKYDALCAALDVWETEHPNLVLPWREAREEWKRAGRPRPAWYEVLWLWKNPCVPVKKKEIEQHLITNEARRERLNKARAKKKAARD